MYGVSTLQIRLWYTIRLYHFYHSRKCAFLALIRFLCKKQLHLCHCTLCQLQYMYLFCIQKAARLCISKCRLLCIYQLGRDLVCSLCDRRFNHWGKVFS